MLTWEDCVGLCEVDPETIDAIAEHERVPEIVALELANYLIHCPDGVPRIKRMIIEDIDASRGRGDAAHTRHLLRTLRHFIVYARSRSAQT